MDEYERLETLRKRLKDQERWDGLDNERLRRRRYEVEIAIKDLLLAEPLEAATALVSSTSSPTTTGPMERLTGSPGASHVSIPPQTTDKDTSESSRSAQSGMAGELLEETAERCHQEMSESLARLFSQIRLLM